MSERVVIDTGTPSSTAIIEPIRYRFISWATRRIAYKR